MRLPATGAERRRPESRSRSVPDGADAEVQQPRPRVTERSEAPHRDANLGRGLVAMARVESRDVDGNLSARRVEAEVSRRLAEVHRVLQLWRVRETEHRAVPARVAAEATERDGA